VVLAMAMVVMPVGAVVLVAVRRTFPALRRVQLPLGAGVAAAGGPGGPGGAARAGAVGMSQR